MRSIPVTIFSPVFRFIFTFLIPIAFIAYYPSLVILRPDEVPLLSWLSPLIGILFFIISYKIWMYGAMKYSGTGFIKQICLPFMQKGVFFSSYYEDSARYGKQ